MERLKASFVLGRTEIRLKLKGSNCGHCGECTKSDPDTFRLIGLLAGCRPRDGRELLEHAEDILLQAGLDVLPGDDSRFSVVASALWVRFGQKAEQRKTTEAEVRSRRGPCI